MASKTLYLICGVPGSGKSTIAKSLKLSNNIDAYFEADMYFETSEGYKYDPYQVVDAHEWCFNTVKAHMLGSENIAVANTFTKKVYVQRYIDLAKELGYNIVEIVMKSTFTDTHGVPPSTISKMKAQLQERLSKAWTFII